MKDAFIKLLKDSLKARIEQEEKSKEMISQIQNGLRETEDIISKLKG